MRLFGHKIFFGTPSRPQASLLVLLASAFAGSLAPLHAQTAPYVLPYTMSTFAGPNPNYTVGAACTPAATGVYSTLKALDVQGDGCLASQVSIGVDPHDIRVDAKGNVYWLDNSSGSITLVHKISVDNQLSTVYLGTNGNSSACSAHTDTYGDGCPSTDGAAGANTTILTTANKFKNQRGMAMAPNGDLFTAGYNDYNIHKVSAATGLFAYTTTVPTTTIISGTLSQVAGLTQATAATTSVVAGPALTSGLGSSRGVGVDPSGNIFIADTGNSIIQEVSNSTTVCGSITPPCTIPVTGANAGSTKLVTSGVPASSALVEAPEDVQIDSFGNIFIADAGNNVLRAIYVAGTLPGVVAPIVGDIYTIAGGGATAYPKNGTTPTMLGTSIAITLRKIGIDNHNNIFIADSGSNVVWFVDNATGFIRVAAGSYGGAQTAPLFSTPYGCAAQTNALGDGCPASYAAITAASDMGTAPDNQGNLYITDAENATAALSRLRKVLSGLNFPAVAVATPVTQTLLVHFAPLDTPATPVLTTGFKVTGSNFTLGTPTCTVETDTTDDCTLPVTFTPTGPGYLTATLTITSTSGGINTYLLTGTGTSQALAIDPGTASLNPSTINNAQGAVLDGAGNLYIADTANNRVLKYTAATTTTAIFAGAGTVCSGKTDSFGDGCLATAATLNAPKAVAIDTLGNVYIADTGNNLIRKVTAASGIITTYAGGATTVCTASTDTLGDGCLGPQAKFSAPSGLAADSLGQLYVADTGNNVIRQISTDGFATLLAGGATTICVSPTDTQGDGCPGLQATFSGPTGLAFDPAGNYLFVADTGNSNIRKIFLANVITATATVPSANIGFLNPVTLVAGNGQAGSSLSSTGLATATQLFHPTGVAVDAAENIYIADTGNASARLVDSATGIISVIAGILNAPGTGTALPTSAINAQLTTPAAVAVSPLGLLYIVDSGNNRVLSDNRSQVAYNFGRINVGSSSQLQPFTEVNIGTTTDTLPSATQITASGNTTQFTLAAPSGSSGCASSLTIGNSCIVNGQFTPTAANATPYSATYTDTVAFSGVFPSINLIGTGAVLTPTTSAVVQTAPTGNSQYGASLTLTATVSATCNTAAPSCYPSGTMKIVVDGNAGSPIPLTATATAAQTISGLSVGTHTISCIYSGDNFYASSTCPNITITVVQATTISVLTAAPNNQPQFTTATLTANVSSSTIGIPTGSVNFYSDGTLIGNGPLSTSGSSAVATLVLSASYDSNNNLIGPGNTLLPGTHTLTCTFVGSTNSNYATSNCAAVSFTVAPQTPALLLYPRACNATVFTVDGTLTPTTNPALTLLNICNPGPATNVAVPTLAVADGATTDATVLILPTNNLSGSLSFSCTGMPVTTTCTFSPQTLALTPSTGVSTLLYFDVTFWTDLQASYITSLHKPSLGVGTSSKSGIQYALILGWPFTLLGLVAFARLRRKSGAARGLSLLAMLLVMTGSSLLFTSCAGPGTYTPALTPAGTYPITITVTGGGVTATTQVIFKVTSPGITGQQ